MLAELDCDWHVDVLVVNVDVGDLHGDQHLDALVENHVLVVANLVTVNVHQLAHASEKLVLEQCRQRKV